MILISGCVGNSKPNIAEPSQTIIHTTQTSVQIRSTNDPFTYVNKNDKNDYIKLYSNGSCTTHLNINSYIDKQCNYITKDQTLTITDKTNQTIYSLVNNTNTIIYKIYPKEGKRLQTISYIKS